MIVSSMISREYFDFGDLVALVRPTRSAGYRLIIQILRYRVRVLLASNLHED